MSISDSATIWLHDEKISRLAGSSLVATLYRTPLTITMTGELGAGKTTFLQGFAQSIGIQEHLTSPTYALEQRYRTAAWGELLHLDLYRLSEEQARQLVAASDEHGGIRCIEWGNRMTDLTEHSDVHIHLEEDPRDPAHTRILTITFRDIALPSAENVQHWRDTVHLPINVRKHCDTVAGVCVQLGALLLQRGVLLRPTALRRAGELHDLLRFIDFDKKGIQPLHESSEEDEHVWEQWRKELPDRTHEEAAEAFLRKKGFPDLARIIEMHGLNLENTPQMTIEQKLLFYADKRVLFDRVVTAEERFADFERRYSNGKKTDFGRRWQDVTRQLEAELFPEGAPTSSALVAKEVQK